MNFAFPALMILVLSLPGIFYRFGYRYGLVTHVGNNDGLGDLSVEIAKGVVVAVFIHLFATCVLRLIYPLLPYTYPANFKVVFDLLAGNNTTDKFQNCLNNLARYFHPISVYILITTFGGLVTGMLSRQIIKVLFLDVKFPLFRMQNPWEYFFNGGDHALALLEGSDGKVNYFELRKLLKQEVTCYVSLLVETPDSVMVINGMVSSYDFNSVGDLDRIILEKASRMNLPTKEINIVQTLISASDAILKDADLGYVKILGDRFVIPYAGVKNMSAIFSFSDETNPSQDAEAQE